MSALGKSGPKVRPEGVADGEQVEIPALHMIRTVGTHGRSMSRGKENLAEGEGRDGRKIRRQKAQP